jgi:hypothetical protein
MSDHSPTSDCVDYTRVMRYAHRLRLIIGLTAYAATAWVLL